MKAATPAPSCIMCDLFRSIDWTWRDVELARVSCRSIRRRFGPNTLMSARESEIEDRAKALRRDLNMLLRHPHRGIRNRQG